MIVATIILAGGKGLRLTPPNSKKSNSKTAKQFLEIGGNVVENLVKSVEAHVLTGATQPANVESVN